jgi:hypothetical protein
MADTKAQTEETQAEPTETESAQPQEGAEETPAEGAEAKKPEGEEAEQAEPAEGEEPAPESAEKPAEKPAEKHKRAGGWERKIQKLEREREILLEQLAAQRGEKPAEKPSDKPKTPDEQVADFIAAQVQKQLAAEREAAAQREAEAAFQERVKAARAEHPDFDDVIEGASHVTVSPAVAQALLTSKHSARIMYKLAANPAELARVSALPPFDAAREIGRLEAELASSTAAPSKPTRSASRPPAPPTSVSGSPTPTTRSLDDLPMSEYKRAFRSGRR